METSKPAVLVVDDDQEMVRVLQAVLKKLDVDLRIAVTARQALQVLDEVVPAVVLLDLKLPDAPGTDILAEIKRRGVPCTVIVMTAHGSVEVAVEAIQQGAYDFLTKPLDFDRVLLMVRHGLERHRLIEQLDDFSADVERLRYRALRGSSLGMQRLYRGIQSNAAGGAPVLILGQPGSEFREAAQSIHDEHQSGEGRFVVAHPDKLESEEVLATLFGAAGLPGAANEASGGTLLLEGIHRLPRQAQRALFLYLRDGERTAGATPSSGAEPRILAWALEKLPHQVETGEFDADLFHVLSAVMLRLPPLHDRGEDVLQLALEFLGQEARRQQRLVSRFADDAEEALMRYDWPGNVEELRIAIAEGVEACPGATLRASHLPLPVRQTLEVRAAREMPVLRGTAAQNVVRPLWQTEQEEIEKALKLCTGNVLTAARILEISPGTIYRKQQAWAGRKR